MLRNFSKFLFTVFLLVVGVGLFGVSNPVSAEINHDAGPTGDHNKWLPSFSDISIEKTSGSLGIGDQYKITSEFMWTDVSGFTDTHTYYEHEIFIENWNLFECRSGRIVTSQTVGALLADIFPGHSGLLDNSHWPLAECGDTSVDKSNLPSGSYVDTRLFDGDYPGEAYTVGLTQVPEVNRLYSVTFYVKRQSFSTSSHIFIGGTLNHWAGQFSGAPKVVEDFPLSGPSQETLFCVGAPLFLDMGLSQSCVFLSVSNKEIFSTDYNGETSFFDFKHGVSTPPNTNPPLEISTCPNSENGFYCGKALGSQYEQEALYKCTNGDNVKQYSCSLGCIMKPAGTADACRTSGTGSCPSGNGYYCGQTLGLDHGTLYHCASGAISVQQACANGCQINPPGVADACSAAGSGNPTPSTEKASLWGNSDYTSLRLEIPEGEHNSPDLGAHYKSLKLPSGWSAYLYDKPIGQDGRSECFSGSSDQLESKGWYTSIDAIKVSTTNICPATGSYVAICHNTGGAGDAGDAPGCTKVDTEQRSLGNFGFGNDVLKSITVRGDWDAVLFEHDNYEGSWFQNNGNVNDLGGISFGYGTSSIQVRKTSPAAFTLYTLGDYNDGNPFKSDRTLSNLQFWKADNGSWNDRAQSMRVGGGYQVIACAASNFHGVCGRTSSDVSDLNALAQGLRNGVSSVQVCQGTCPATSATPTPISPENNQIFVPGTVMSFSWTGNGDQYLVEINGGDLTQTISSGWSSNGTTWNLPNLPISTNPYTWKVQSWTPYGDSGWSQTFSFSINDIAPESTFIYHEGDVLLNTDHEFEVFVSPIQATNVAYTWSPAPKSGQGTANAIYSWNTPGTKTVGVTVQNTGGTANSSVDVDVACAANQFMTEYYATNDLSGPVRQYLCEDVPVDHDWGVSGPASAISGSVNAGNGADGDLVVASGQVAYTDNVRTVITSQVLAGVTAIQVSSSAGFNVGDEVVMVEMQGTDVGRNQFNRIASISGSTVNFVNPLVLNIYVGGGALAQMVRVPNYNNMTISGTLKAHAWDGTTGGVLAFRAMGTIQMAGGEISASAIGYRGAPATFGRAMQGYQGEGIYSLGSQTRSPGQGGGGGGPGTNDGGASGGGGSHVTAGGNAGDPFFGDPGLGSTLLFGEPTMFNVYMGGAGGAGGTDDSGWDGATNGGRGGNGGGIMLISAGNLLGSGTIASNGENGLNPTHGEHGGGGAGAGGSLKLFVDHMNIDGIGFQAAGGQGGQGKDGRGGTGSNGRLLLSYCQNDGAAPGVTLAEQLPNCTKDNFSARWSGVFDMAPGDYTFHLNSDDGSKLWIDDQVVIDNWTAGIHTSQIVQTISAGSHNIKLEYFEGTGDANVYFDFVIPDPAPQTLEITSSGPAELNGNVTYTAVTGPAEAINLSYVWSPAPQSGQGTANAVYHWGTLGTSSVSVAVQNTGGLLNQTLNVDVGCANNGYVTNYFKNETLNGTAAIQTCEDALSHNWAAGAPAGFSSFSSGVNGALEVSQNLTDSPIDSTAQAVQGSYSILATNAGFAAGQMILVHQTRGTGVGNYQLTRIASYSAGQIVTVDAVNNNYATDSANKAQVLVVKEYTNVSVAAGITLSAKAWNGSTGGILYFVASGNVDIAGTVSAVAAGYRGGNQTNAPQGQHYGNRGEGTLGDRDVRTPAANGNGGGGGQEYNYNGGAGGSYATVGGNGSNNVGQAGGLVGSANLAQLLFGGAGGAAAAGGGGGENGLAGGNGGGIVIIKADAINLTGQINASGANGGFASNHFGGGAGAGGSVMLAGRVLNLGPNLVTANGGVSGGPRPGGVGGSGRIKVEYCDSVNGVSAPAANSAQITCESDHFSGRWQKTATLAAGYYKLHLNADDGAKVWIDDAVVIDNWTVGTHDTYLVTPLSAGSHSFKVEYFEQAGLASIDFDYQLMADVTPQLSDIPDQTVNYGQTFQTINLNNFVTNLADQATLSWEYSGNTNVQVAIAGNVATLTHPPTWTGTEVITFTARNQANQTADNSSSFTVTQQMNSAPVVTQIPGQTINQGQNFATINLANYGSDPDAGDVITWSYSGNTNISVAINGAVATLTYQGSWAGSESITFTATDTQSAQASTTAVFVVNRLPIVNPIPGQTIALTQAFTSINLNTYGSDPDAGDSITWSYSGNTSIGVAIANGVATLTYPAGWTGVENVTFKATDTRGAFAISVAAFRVNLCPTGQYYAQYFNNKTVTGTPALSRCEATAYYDWGGNSPAGGVNADNFSVRWTRVLNVPTTTLYSIRTTSDDGVRVFVDGSAVINNWTDHGATVNTATSNLIAGDHTLVMEYYDAGGGAIAKLSLGWPCAPATDAFCVEYYNNKTLSGNPEYTTTVSTINNDWGSGGPSNGIGADNFSARWQGNFTFTAGNHTFTTTSDDGVRLYVDGNLVINNWTDHGPTNNPVTLNLTAGTHLVKMEYYESGGGAVAKLLMQ